MEIGEVAGLESGLAAEFEGEGVAEREHGGGGGGWGEVEGAGFFRDRDIERDSGCLRQRGSDVSSEADDGHVQTRQDWEQTQEFFCFAGVGQGDNDVAVGEHSQVAVQGFYGVEEAGRGAGREEGGGDLAGDDAGFANAGDGDSMSRCCGVGDEGESVVHGGPHFAVEAVSQAVECLGFHADELRGAGGRIGRIGFRHCELDPPHASRAAKWR